MDRRLELQTLLESVLGSTNVYFQPPPSKVMKYPAIVYELSDFDKKAANNRKYMSMTKYEITLIDRDPDNATKDALSEIPLCGFNRFMITDNLNHYVYELFF